MATVKELTTNELVDQYVFRKNNQYPIPEIAEPQRHALASEYLGIQAGIKQKTGLLPIGMSEENRKELESLKNRAGIIFNFIQESMAFGGLAPDAAVRDYIAAVKALDASSQTQRLQIC